VNPKQKFISGDFKNEIQKIKDKKISGAGREE
jgi:hypothetical protein